MRSAWRYVCLAALSAWMLLAAPVKLYLKSGADMLVREYELKEDRVRYYSIERSQWEEIPARLIDLEKTEQESARQTQRLESMRAESATERRAERKARTELHDVPIDDGIYWYSDSTGKELPQNEVTEEKSTKRKLLRAVAPMPIIAAKRKLLIEGRASEFTVSDAQPIFFVRDPDLVYFGIVRLSPEDDQRLAQVVQIAIGDVYQETQDEVTVFRQQLATSVYRVWPTEDLEPGEYAFINYTPGEMDLRVWSFRYEPAAGE